MEELIEEYTYLIKSIMNKFYNVDKEDLYQAGVLGLIKAVKNYDNKSSKFSTYAYKYIFGEMYDLSMKSRNIKMNKYYLKMYKLINKTKSYLTQKYERDISLKEISEYLNIDEATLNNVTTMMEDMFSLEDEYNNIDVVTNINYDDMILIDDSINSLDPLSSAVINYRYKLDMSQKEVSKLLGISQVSVSRIEKKSKSKILEYIA